MSFFMSEAKIKACVDMLREHNHDAVIVTTPWDQLDGKTLRSAMEHEDSLKAELERLAAEAGEHEDEDECCCGHDHEHHHHHHHGHDADEVFVSWGAETARKFTEAEIVEALQGLDSLRYGQAVRAKGSVASEGEDWIYFDYVPGERELRRGAPAVTGRLCVIGSGLDEEGLRELFKLG